MYGQCLVCLIACGTSAHDIVSERKSYFLTYKAWLIGLVSMLVSEIFQVKSFRDRQG